jgi:hypothetical protein
MIKRLAHYMRQMSWVDTSMILNQFSFPELEGFGGDHLNYLYLRLQGGESKDLVALAGHFFPEEDLTESGSPSDADVGIPSFWGTDKFRLFISHVSRVKETAAGLKVALSKYCIDSFIAHSDIEPTAEWIDEIEKALASCDALVALLTKDFPESKWTDQEVGYCVGMGILIVPVKIHVDPYGFIGRYQAITATNLEIEKLARAIFTVLIGSRMTSETLAPLLVDRFANSGSFDAAKKNLMLIRAIRDWTPSLLDKIESALSNSHQVKEAYGVPAGVKAILQSHGR